MYLQKRKKKKKKKKKNWFILTTSRKAACGLENMLFLSANFRRDVKLCKEVQDLVQHRKAAVNSCGSELGGTNAARYEHKQGRRKWVDWVDSVKGPRGSRGPAKQN